MCHLQWAHCQQHDSDRLGCLFVSIDFTIFNSDNIMADSKLYHTFFT